MRALLPGGISKGVASILKRAPDSWFTKHPRRPIDFFDDGTVRQSGLAAKAAAATRKRNAYGEEMANMVVCAGG
jgi:hypothetical protein